MKGAKSAEEIFCPQMNTKKTENGKRKTENGNCNLKVFSFSIFRFPFSIKLSVFICGQFFFDFFRLSFYRLFISINDNFRQFLAVKSRVAEHRFRCFAAFVIEL